jgi:hypothetical protein
VLARLLELNRQRALEEGQMVPAVEGGGTSGPKKRKQKKNKAVAATPMFDE